MMPDTDKQAAPIPATDTNGTIVEKSTLRMAAEQKMQGESSLSLTAIKSMSPEEILRILHELEVHRIELVMQNEELRVMQLQLDAERLRYVELYRQAPTGYCTLDEQGLFLEANLATASLLGVSLDALIKQPFTRLVLKEDQDIYYLHRKKLYESKEPMVCELRILQENGTIVWAHLVSTAASQAGGTFVCRMVLLDITEQKRGEMALRESNERFKTLHEVVTGGIVIHDRGIILDCNQGLADQTGYSMEELLNKDEEVKLIAPEWRELVRQNIQRGYQQPYEVEGLRKDGTTYPLSIRGRSILYKGRQVRVTEFRDITERKLAEQERERLQAQLLQAQKLESVGRLAGGWPMTSTTC